MAPSKPLPSRPINISATLGTSITSKLDQENYLL
jgi:hypothetical protein